MKLVKVSSNQKKEFSEILLYYPIRLKIYHLERQWIGLWKQKLRSMFPRLILKLLLKDSGQKKLSCFFNQDLRVWFWINQVFVRLLFVFKSIIVFLQDKSFFERFIFRFKMFQSVNLIIIFLIFLSTVKSYTQFYK